MMFARGLDTSKYATGLKFRVRPRCGSTLQLQLKERCNTNACACRGRRLQEKNAGLASFTRYAPPASLLASPSLFLFLSGVISAAHGIKGLIRFLPLSLFVAPCSETRVHCDDVTQRPNGKKMNERANKRERERTLRLITRERRRTRKRVTR